MAVGEVAKLMVTVGADVRQLQQGFQSATQGIQSFNRTASTILGVGGLISTVAIAGQAINQALDFGAAGAKLLNLENSFNSFAQSTGESGAAVLAEMQAMSGGMMTQSALMEQYNRAFLLAGADIANSMPQIVQLAQASAAAGMGDFEYLLQSAVTGLGRLSPLILDNLGYTMNLETAYAKYAGTLGVSAASLTKTQQQQALLNEMMDQAQAKFGDVDAAAQNMAGGGVARLRAAWAGLMDEMQREAAPTIDQAAGLVATTIESRPGGSQYSTAIIGDIEAISAGGREAELVMRRMGVAAGDTTGAYYQLMGVIDYAKLSNEELAEIQARLTDENLMLGLSFAEQSGQIANTRNEQAYMIATSERLMGAMGGVNQATQDTTLSAEELNTVISEMGGSLDAWREAANARAKAAEYEADAFHGVGDAYEEAARTGLEARDTSLDLAPALDGVADAASRVAQNLADANAMLATFGSGSLVDAQRNATTLYTMRRYGAATTPTGEPLTFENVQAPWEARHAVTDYVGGIADADAALQQMGSTGSSSWNDLQSAMESYYSSWQSSAASITDPTQSVDFTALEDKAGLHEDTFDENAKRAMDVYNLGAESPWAEQLGFSDQASALQYMKDFYAGNLPSDQYNWEAGAAQYAEQMGQQAGANNLAAQMQQYLVDAGLGPDNPVIAQALGDPLGIAGTDAAGLFGENFASAMGAVDFTSPAETAAQQVLAGWVSGMKSPDDTTVKALFGMLWKLIEPAVRAMLNDPL